MQHGIQGKPQAYQSYAALKKGRDFWRVIGVLATVLFLGSLFVILALLGYIGTM